VRCFATAVATALFSTGATVSSYAEAAPAAAPNPGWETTAAAGLTLTRGNSDTLSAVANLLSQKKWEQNELRFGADATYGENDDQKNAESIHGFGQYNRLFTERAYGYARIDALHDAVADVEYRLTLSPGVGYYFIKNERTSLSGEVGPGVVFEKQGSDETTYLTIRFAERFEHKLNDRVRIWQSLEWLPQVDDFDNWILNAEIGLETQLTEKLSLRVFALDTYDNQPAAGREENDLKLVTAVAYKF
jgi:putative salt-induced outer membrane protein YdiY